MEIQTKRIIDLHKIDKRLNQIEDEKGDLPALISEEEENLYEFKETISINDQKNKELDKNINKAAMLINDEEFLFEINETNFIGNIILMESCRGSITCQDESFNRSSLPIFYNFNIIAIVIFNKLTKKL